MTTTWSESSVRPSHRFLKLDAEPSFISITDVKKKKHGYQLLAKHVKTPLETPFSLVSPQRVVSFAGGWDEYVSISIG
jgi:hypothetical protein